MKGGTHQQIILQIGQAAEEGEAMKVWVLVSVLFLMLYVTAVILILYERRQPAGEKATVLPIATATQPVADTCADGIFMAWNQDWGGFVVLGDTKICGVGLHFEAIHGPSQLPDPIEKYISKEKP